MKKRRVFALALACALSLALLTSCGGNSGSGSSASGGGSSVSGSGSNLPGSSSSQDGSDLSVPGSSQTDASQSGSSQSSGSASSQQPDGSQTEQAKLTLNRTEFALFTTGSSFRLKAAGVPEGTTVTWKSSNDKVASVGEDGTVTYVAAGNATITATAGDLTATCKVYCKAEENTQKPENPDNGGSSSGSGSSSSGGSSSQSVDLKSFADTAISNYELPFMSEMDSTMLSNYLPGLSDLSAQLVAYTCQMMPSPAGDLVLVEVKDSKDVASVKDILQAHIDYMAGTDENPGAAWYPDPIRMWKEDSRIVSNGNYVMLVVCGDCDSIVKDFNALF